MRCISSWPVTSAGCWHQINAWNCSPKPNDLSEWMYEIRTFRKHTFRVMLPLTELWVPGWRFHFQHVWFMAGCDHLPLRHPPVYFWFLMCHQKPSKETYRKRTGSEVCSCQFMFQKIFSYIFFKKTTTKKTNTNYPTTCGTVRFNVEKTNTHRHTIPKTYGNLTWTYLCRSGGCQTNFCCRPHQSDGFLRLSVIPNK